MLYANLSQSNEKNVGGLETTTNKFKHSHIKGCEIQTLRSVFIEDFLIFCRRRQNTNGPSTDTGDTPQRASLTIREAIKNEQSKQD